MFQIDVLTFGFWPLRGESSGCVSDYSGSRTERMSAIEIAILAESKRFLSSPLVVQVLENIWSGKIVFYSSTDKGYDAISFHHTRKTASLYNVKEASLFKLSRLRVPRYRHFMQTVSFAIVYLMKQFQTYNFSYLASIWPSSFRGQSCLPPWKSSCPSGP